jgi:hypothetical protein
MTPGAAPLKRRRRFLVFVAPTLVALLFVHSYAYQYLSTESERLGIFWSLRHWLHPHVIAGTFALLVGPFQLWIGVDRRFPLAHRVLGIGYVLAVGIASAASFKLAANTGFGWVFAFGFAAMAGAWIVTTAVAVIAICRRMVEQHKAWMIRSYTVTFGFVNYRVFIELFRVLGIGNTTEQLTAAAWAGWAIPLLITEVALQGREVFAPLQIPRAAPAEQAARKNLAPSHFGFRI